MTVGNFIAQLQWRLITSENRLDVAYSRERRFRLQFANNEKAVVQDLQRVITLQAKAKRKRRPRKGRRVL